MNISLFIVMLFCLQFFYWYVGKRASKGLKGQEDYFLAGKTVKFFPLMMTFFATQVGGGIVLGSADEAFKFGWPVLMYPLGAALGLILLGCGVGRRLARFKVSTIAQILEVTYGSTLLKKIASLLSIISLFMILVAQIIASHKFLISLGLNNTPLFIVFWAIVIIYTVQGGLKAVISTDMAQAGFFLVVFFLCFFYVIAFEPSVSACALPTVGALSSVSGKLTGWLLMPLCFMMIEQDMGQRCFAGASPQVVSKASLWAGLATLCICVVPVFFGTWAQGVGLCIPQGGSVLMHAAMEATNPFLSALIGCAILAAIISTATSLINAISSNLSGDFRLTFFAKKSPLRQTRIVTGALSLLAILFAFYFNNIVDLLIQSYELSVSCLFVPVVMALFRKQGHFASALSAILLGAFGFFFFRLYPPFIPQELASLALSFLGYFLGGLKVARFLPKTD